MTTALPPFEVPTTQVARRPPEARDLRRDEVRLLVATPTGLTDTTMRHVADHLHRGDLLVVNTSATLPAALAGHRGDGRLTVVHVAEQVAPGRWVVELRRPDGSGPQLDGRRGEEVRLAAGPRLRLVAGAGTHPSGVRLWRTHVRTDGRPVHLHEVLRRHGRPVTYGHLAGAYPLEDHQTVFAREPGSAEMPSAGRPFTPSLLRSLAAAGVEVAPLVLHSGLSSPEAGEPPRPERFRVGPRTARRVRRARSDGDRVVAVGTTVVRALESAADAAGSVHAVAGRTRLVLGPRRPARVVDGLLTGWHESTASHLDLLTAVAGEQLVARAYAAALDSGHLWHEFGDLCLLLP